MWTYNNKEINNIEDFGTPSPFGFVYLITHKETGKFYIGKKQLISVVNKKLGKKELIKIKEERKENKVQGKLPTKKKVTSENNWLNYWGSSKELCEEINKQGQDKFERVIIQLAYTSKLLTYYEAMYQMKYDVLQIDSFNHNILGKIHRKDFL
jgi:serine/threonine protein kinase